MLEDTVNQLDGRHLTVCHDCICHTHMRQAGCVNSGSRDHQYVFNRVTEVVRKDHCRMWICFQENSNTQLDSWWRKAPMHASVAFLMAATTQSRKVKVSGVGIKRRRRNRSTLGAFPVLLFQDQLGILLVAGNNNKIQFTAFHIQKVEYCSPITPHFSISLAFRCSHQTRSFPVDCQWK